MILFHARQASVADQVFLQVRVDRALAAEPGKGAFCFLAQANLLKFGFPGRRGGRELYFDQAGAGSADGGGLGVPAAGGDELGLGERVGGEDFEDGGEVLVGELVRLAAEEAADITTGQTGPPGNVALVELAALGLALEGNAEIAHSNAECGLRIAELPGFMTGLRIYFLPAGFHSTQHLSAGNGGNPGAFGGPRVLTRELW